MAKLVTPGYRALRKGRYSEAGRPYLLTTTTVERKPLFRELIAARTVIRAMRFQHERQRIESLAFVVMPDHLHWLVVLRGAVELEKVMHSLKSYSAHTLGGGDVWQEGFHDRALRKEESIRDAARYIIANPLRAGLVQHIGDYPHWDAVWLE
jgi:putative transposase